MALKTIAFSAVLVVLPTLAFAMGCQGGHSKTVASCPEGQVWDMEVEACIDMVTG